MQGTWVPEISEVGPGCLLFPRWVLVNVSVRRVVRSRVYARHSLGRAISHSNLKSLSMIFFTPSRLALGYPATVAFCLAVVSSLGGCQPSKQQANQNLPAPVSSESSSGRSLPSTSELNGRLVRKPAAPEGIVPTEHPTIFKATGILPLEDPATSKTPWRARTNDFADWPKIDLPIEIVLTIPPDVEGEEPPSPSPDRPAPTGGSGQWLEGLRKLLPF